MINWSLRAAGCHCRVLLPCLWQRLPAKCLCDMRFGARVLVLMQGAAVGLLPDVYGSLSFGAWMQGAAAKRFSAQYCITVMFMAVHDLECGCWCLPTKIFCYLRPMQAYFLNVSLGFFGPLPACGPLSLMTVRPYTSVFAEPFRCAAACFAQASATNAWLTKLSEARAVQSPSTLLFLLASCYY